MDAAAAAATVEAARTGRIRRDGVRLVGHVLDLIHRVDETGPHRLDRGRGLVGRLDTLIVTYLILRQALGADGVAALTVHHNVRPHVETDRATQVLVKLVGQAPNLLHFLDADLLLHVDHLSLHVVHLFLALSTGCPDQYFPVCRVHLLP